MDDGSFSPDFHIPGRVKNATDLEVIPYSESNPDLDPLEVKASYER